MNTILDQLTEDPQVKDIKTAIKNLLGENFGEYLNQYKTTDDFVGAIDEAAAAALKKENSVLAAAIMEKIDRKASSRTRTSRPSSRSTTRRFRLFGTPSTIWQAAFSRSYSFRRR